MIWAGPTSKIACGPIKFLAGAIKRAYPATPHLQGRSLEEAMNLNLLKKIAKWGLAVGAVLISPAILVYGVLFAFSIVSDIVRLSGGPIILADLIASPVAFLMLCRAQASAAA